MAGEQENFVPATEQPFASEAETPSEPEAEATIEEPVQEPVDETTDDNESEPADELDEELAAAKEEAEGKPDEGDFEDFDFDGTTIRGPKGLKDRVMMHADYTKKTQEVADRRRELESFEQTIRQRAEATDEEMSIRAHHASNQEQIAEYNKIDWDAWSNQDPIECQQAWMRFQGLQQSQGELGQRLNEHTQRRSHEAQQDIAKRIGETREYASKNIQGFSPEVEKRVIDFALEQGLPKEALQASINPVVFDLLHKAMLGAEVLKKPAAPPKKATVPLKTVSSRSNSPVHKSLEDMSMDEYVAAAKKQGRYQT